MLGSLLSYVKKVEDFCTGEDFGLASVRWLFSYAFMAHHVEFVPLRCTRTLPGCVSVCFLFKSLSHL